MLGRRIAKRVYSAATGGTVGFTRFVYHGGQVAFETDSAGSTIGTRYVWGPGTDNLVAFRATAAATDHYYVATDKLGSVHQIIKRDGTWVRTYGYTPYGSVAASAGSGVTLRYRWTGREWDAETGWYFHRARYYDPGQRRFVQEDPAGAAGGENLYAYVGGQALVLRDPSGQWAEGGPPQPFQDPCPGFDTCYEHGIEIDGVFVKGWDLGMVARFNFKTNSERAGNGCPAWLNEASVEGAINDVWDASMSSQPDDLGRVPEFGVALSGSAGGLVAGGLIEGSHDPNDAFGVSASLTAGQHFALVHSHPNAGKPWPELGSGMTFGDKLSGTFGDIGRGGDWAIATQGFWVVAVGKSSNSRRLGLRVGSPEGKSSMCSVAKRVSAP
ncbi:MAG: RHS repeat-associated core domain-containing protein [Gemmatimonadetes bacterium]|nr:RHS repeat-associated core domain-containing protein [Gemmatimonadota bacterium]